MCAVNHTSTGDRKTNGLLLALWIKERINLDIMKISIENGNGLTVVLTSGKMDATNCGELEDVLDKIIGEGCPQIILNFDGLSYITIRKMTK